MIHESHLSYTVLLRNLEGWEGAS